MNCITETYSLKWRHRYHSHYQWTECGKLFNLQTGRRIKKTINGGSIGYWIKGKFEILESLKSKVERIKEVEVPF